MRILEWVAIPFCRGSSWPRNWTWVSCITGRFFTIWATRQTPGEVFSFSQLYKILLFHATENNVRWGTTGKIFSICFCHDKWQILISEAHLTRRIRYEFTAPVSASVPQLSLSVKIYECKLFCPWRQTSVCPFLTCVLKGHFRRWEIWRLFIITKIC